MLCASLNGIGSFALVHDSYGTVAADVSMMVACLKRSFINLYTEQDPMESFFFDILALVAEEAATSLPPVPAKGDLDLSLVEQSDFFFA